MTSDGRDVLIAELQPFLNTHGLVPRWVDPEFLRMEHPKGTNASAVIEFASGFWEAYEKRSSFTQTQARHKLLTQVKVPYKSHSNKEPAVVGHGTMDLLIEDT